MRICIYGAGAIGGYLGVQLALAGEEVTLLARGPHLEAMQRNGVRLLIGDEERIAHPVCTDDTASAGVQDYVIITLKAHSVPAIVEPLQVLLGPETAVVTASNGVPWWYFYGLEGPWHDRRLESVAIGAIGVSRVISEAQEFHDEYGCFGGAIEKPLELLRRQSRCCDEVLCGGQITRRSRRRGWRVLFERSRRDQPLAAQAGTSGLRCLSR